jgi:branched-subunit amino acid transport protein
MSEGWLVVLAVGAGTMAIKAAGPVGLGERPLPAPVQAVVALLAPALLAALVATATLATDTRLAPDARLIGLTAAAVGLLLRAPVLVVVVAAAAAAALARLAGIG